MLAADCKAENGALVIKSIDHDATGESDDSDHASHCCVHSHFSGFYVSASADMPAVFILSSFAYPTDGSLLSRSIPPLLEPPSHA